MQMCVLKESCLKSFRVGLIPYIAVHQSKGPAAQPALAALSCSLSLWRAAAASSLAARCFKKSLPITPSQSWLSSDCKCSDDFSNVIYSLKDIIRTPLDRIRKLCVGLQ